MRATVRNLLIATPSLTALVPSERWFSPGAVLDTPILPFVVLRWLSPVPLAGSFGRQLRVDVHDERGSYNVIEAVLGDRNAGGGVYSVLSNAYEVTGSDGYLAEATYLGESGDQEDPDYKSNYKFSSWQIIGRNL